ncbi:MAG: hypothetical protein M3M88_04125 [Thermoproteota archaeon]|nr:hypothetical protein [Thermoproteota archaeon]
MGIQLRATTQLQMQKTNPQPKPECDIRNNNPIPKRHNPLSLIAVGIFGNLEHNRQGLGLGPVENG